MRGYMQISKLWKKRILNFKEHGNDFTYSEIAEMAGVSRGNVSVVIRKMLEENSDVVSRIEGDEDNKIRFRFNYDILTENSEETIDEPELPAWISAETYKNILSVLDLSDNLEIRIHYRDWVPKFQRGGIIADVYEKGQKTPEYTLGIRIDNCIILSWGVL